MVNISNYIPSSVILVFSVVKKTVTTEGTEKRLWAESAFYKRDQAALTTSAVRKKQKARNTLKRYGLF
jgi:hypothetical protein